MQVAVGENHANLVDGPPEMGGNITHTSNSIAYNLATKRNKFPRERSLSLETGLDGGGCSLLQTCLRGNSLLTGKFTGNFSIFWMFGSYTYS